MKKSSFLIILLCSIAAVSCSDEYDLIGPGSTRTTYLFRSYFIPTHAGFTEDDWNRDGKGYSWRMKLWNDKEDITLTDNSVPTEEFKKLASEYNEDGREFVIYQYPPLVREKPYGISRIRVLRIVQNDTTDISDKASIEFLDYSQFIVPGYALSPDLHYRMKTVKKLSDLTDKDLKWLPTEIVINLHNADTENRKSIFLEIKTGEEKVLLIKMPMRYKQCQC